MPDKNPSQPGGVTREDRDAAADLYGFTPGSEQPEIAKIRTGDGDNHPFAQAFARHRLAAHLSGLREAAGRLEAEAAYYERDGKSGTATSLMFIAQQLRAPANEETGS